MTQPILGRVADINGYGPSFLVAGAFHALALPFVWLARRQDAPGEVIQVPALVPKAT